MVFRNMDGNDVSLLGFGCMRFPLDESGEIDSVKAAEMLDTAFENGVNYFDTAYTYHDNKSEIFTGNYLNKHPRDKYFLATKLPCWEVNSLDDAKRIFAEQLEKLDKDYIDFYLLHALNKGSFDKMVSLGVPEFCDELKKQGKIKHFGFSFHDGFDAFEHIVTARKWDFCQLQINYMDIHELKSYELAKKLGVSVIVMEPIRGGSLANLPDDISTLFNSIEETKSSAYHALKWVANHSNVKTILSGMSTLDQVKDNLETFATDTSLSDSDMKVYDDVYKAMKNRIKVGCTGCNYCMPCPAGVNIPYVFRVWNDYGVYNNTGHSRWEWNEQVPADAKPTNCVGCGKCEEACPQKIKIIDVLKTAEMEMNSL